MKRINILFTTLIIATLGVFTSCEDESYLAPQISFTNGVTEAELDPGVSSYTITGTITAEAGLDEVKLFAVDDFGETQIGDAIVSFNAGSPVTEGADGVYDFVFDIENIEGDITVEVQATDTENQTTSRNFEIMADASVMLTDPIDDTWSREGGDAGTGVDMFGLQWVNNLKADVNAVIAKEDAEKFVQLNESDWNDIQTYDELVAAVDNADDMSDYRGVSAEVDATYNDVLATKYNGEYYLILVQSADVTVDDVTGTTVVIDIDYKTAPEE